MAEFTAAPLFHRLSPGLFRLLGMPNGRRYWLVLSRLMDEMRGDGARSRGEEAPKVVVVRVIESFLAADDPWEGEVETNVTTRAHEITNKLIENDWLSQRRRGAVEMVMVRPLVAQFFAVLCDFSVQELGFLSSKFRSILLNRQTISTGGAEDVDQYAEDRWWPYSP